MSEHLYAVNLLRDKKHCLNKHGSLYVGFIDQYERKLARKILS